LQEQGKTEMSRARLEVIYDGDALENGVMDVQDLAPALLGIADVCQRANRVLNGDQARLSVQVEADMKRGCFHVDLNLVSHVLTITTPLITAINLDHVKTAKDVAELLFGGDISVAALIRRLKGKRPKDVPHKDLGDGRVVLNIGGDAGDITIHYNTYNIANDPQVRTGFKKATRPLTKAGIEQLEIGPPDNATTIQKDEAQYFVEPSELGGVTEDERDETIQVVAFNFEDRYKSKFTADGNAVFTASIDDDAFWMRVATRNYRPGKGDRYLVRMLVRRQEKPKLRTEYHILEVLDVLEPAPPDEEDLTLDFE